MSSPQAKLFDEVRGTEWSAYQVTFSYESKHECASIVLDGCGCFARISGAGHHAALTRAGYVAGSDWHRPLENLDEVRAEREVLTSFVRTSVMEGPRRRARRMPGPGKRPIPGDMVTSMRRTSWSWSATCVGRAGRPAFVDPKVWRAVAWCLVIDDDGPQFDVGLQIYSKGKPNAASRARAKRALDAALRPRAYELARIPIRLGPFFMANKTLHGSSEARRERARLDGLFR